MKVIKYLEAVEEALQGKNVSGTCQVQEDKIVCNNEEITIKSKLENAIEGSLVIENNKVKSYNNLKYATEKKTETNNEVPQIIDEQNTSNENTNTNETIASEDTDYRGYYADVDGDGTVDGVIYADLNKAESGQWHSNGTYSYTKETGLKEYTVSKEKYTEGKFGEKEIISLKSTTSGKARFYVMALENFTTTDYTTFYWYKNANGKMNALDTSKDFGEGKENTGTIIRIWNNNGAEEGRRSGATQNNQDIWNHIQEKYQEGWYIPSYGEWAAFADYFTNKTDLEKKLRNSNYYVDFGLSGWYWSSSQYDAGIAWVAAFYYGYMDYFSVNRDRSVRLGATF